MSEFTLIEASGEGRPKIVGIAYSGGKMPLPGWKNPVVVDLSGMDLPESVPLLANHENRTSARVGMVSAHVKNNQLEITGEIISDRSFRTARKPRTSWRRAKLAPTGSFPLEPM